METTAIEKLEKMESAKNIMNEKQLKKSVETLTKIIDETIITDYDLNYYLVKNVAIAKGENITKKDYAKIQKIVRSGKSKMECEKLVKEYFKVTW